MVEKIRVGWLEHNVGITGGAEMSSSSIQLHAPSHVEIIYCPANKRPKTEDIDVFVIQNCVTYQKEWIEELGMKPVIKQIRDPWYAGSPILRRWLLENADALIFSSQTQIDLFDYEFGSMPVYKIPVPVKLDEFRLAGENTEKRTGTVFVGRTDTFKGMHTVIDWALRNKEQLTVVGNKKWIYYNPDQELPGYIQFIGSQPYSSMPEILAKHEKYIALPMWPEAFGRSVVEAWAAGCSLILNDRVGAKDWINHEPERLGFYGPINEFWDIVEEVVNA